jgi:hypothetical protein
MKTFGRATAHRGLIDIARTTAVAVEARHNRIGNLFD